MPVVGNLRESHFHRIVVNVCSLLSLFLDTSPGSYQKRSCIPGFCSSNQACPERSRRKGGTLGNLLHKNNMFYLCTRTLPQPSIHLHPSHIQDLLPKCVTSFHINLIPLRNEIYLCFINY